MENNTATYPPFSVKSTMSRISFNTNRAPGSNVDAPVYISENEYVLSRDDFRFRGDVPFYYN